MPLSCVFEISSASNLLYKLTFLCLNIIYHSYKYMFVCGISMLKEHLLKFINHWLLHSSQKHCFTYFLRNGKLESRCGAWWINFAWIWFIFLFINDYIIWISCFCFQDICLIWYLLFLWKEKDISIIPLPSWKCDSPLSYSYYSCGVQGWNYFCRICIFWSPWR